LTQLASEAAGLPKRSPNRRSFRTVTRPLWLAWLAKVESEIVEGGRRAYGASGDAYSMPGGMGNVLGQASIVLTVIDSGV
jgi:hypothetical protein